MNSKIFYLIVNRQNENVEERKIREIADLKQTIKDNEIILCGEKQIYNIGDDTEI